MNTNSNTCSAFVRFVDDKDHEPGETFTIEAGVKQFFRGNQFIAARCDLATVIEFGIVGFKPDIRLVSFSDLVHSDWVLSAIEPYRQMRLTLQAIKPIRASEGPFVVTLKGQTLQLPIDVTAETSK